MGYLVENKNFDDLEMRFCIPFWKKTTLDFYIWKTIDAMHNAAHPRGGRDWLGCYVGMPLQRGKRGNGPYPFGEIHLLSGEVYAEIVSHEIAHAVFDWLDENGINRTTNERMAYLTSSVTGNFWDEFYKHYERRPLPVGFPAP